MKKRLISMLCASTIAFLLALPSYAFDSDMATSAKVNADIAELKETYSIDSNLMQDVICRTSNRGFETAGRGLSVYA